MKNKIVKNAVLGFLMLFSFQLFAQSSLKGVVQSEEGPLLGATVQIKNSNVGVLTDFDGNFTIEASVGDILLISYVGYNSQEISIQNFDFLTINLMPQNLMDEVVVVGYSSQTRGGISGSVASVNVDQAMKTPVVNAAEALQGQVTGVQVITNANPGQAPKINIRGFGTSNNTNPLYIIDGVQTDDPLALNNINPSDIDQMNVLKDGAAAIYGARASNGVIIITTKSGGYSMTGPKVSLDMYTGFSEISNTPGLLNAQQHADMIWQSYTNDGITPSHGQYGTGTSPTIPSQIAGYRRVVSYNPILF